VNPVGLFRLTKGTSLALDAETGQIAITIYFDHVDGSTDETRVFLNVETAANFADALRSALRIAGHNEGKRQNKGLEIVNALERLSVEWHKRHDRAIDEDDDAHAEVGCKAEGIRLALNAARKVIGR
jgi:hypothetical protein